MEVTFDPEKRDATLADRGLDFADAIEVFEGSQSTCRTCAGTTAKNASLPWDISAAGWSSWFGPSAGERAASFPLGKPMNRNEHRLGSDLARVDTHVIRPHEYDEIPELSDTDFSRGIVHEGGLPMRRGRPKPGAPKQQVTLRLDRDVSNNSGQPAKAGKAASTPPCGNPSSGRSHHDCTYRAIFSISGRMVAATAASVIGPMNL